MPTEHTEYTERKSGSEFRVIRVFRGQPSETFVPFVFFVVTPFKVSTSENTRAVPDEETARVT